MPAKINVDDPFDLIEDEVMFTISSVKADEDAADLVAETESWLPLVDEARTKDRAFRAQDMQAAATRGVANTRLDIACIAFGKDLLYDVGDRTRPRFVGFFPVSPARWVKQAFDKQITGVRGWLGSADPVLEKHRAELDERVQRADDSRVATAALAPKRGLNWEMRRELAEALTRARDGLHRALAERAEERKLPREWANTFFRVTTRSEPEPDLPLPTPST